MSALSALRRVDDTIWSCRVEPPVGPISELRIATAPSSVPAVAYRLACCAHQVLQTDLETLTNGRTRRFRVVDDQTLRGIWTLRIGRVNASALSVLTQAFPFTHTVIDRRIQTVSVNRSYAWPLAMLCRHLGALQLRPEPLPPLERRFQRQWSFRQRLATVPFGDAFTSLAAQALQTVEPRFVPQRSVTGAYQFLWEGNQLQLIERGSGGTEANRDTVTAYYYWAVDEYGQQHLDYVQGAYGIDFAAMHTSGEPLLPDHIFKVNIGVNNIELAHVEELYGRLKALRDRPRGQRGTGIERWLREWPVREQRGLMELIRRDGGLRHTGSVLKVGERPLAKGKLQRGSPQVFETRAVYVQKALVNLLGDDCESVRELDPRRFHDIAGIIMPSPEALDRAFTGRRITHLAICGYDTQGDPAVSDPSRDLFELIHIFGDLQQRNWPSYLELLSHVVAKKSLFRTNGDGKSHVGALIPAPAAADGTPRWYCNETFCDDEQGNINYALIPACADASLPMIKLYRSTASDRGAVSWLDSIAADLNPYGSPGSVNPLNSYPYERGLFQERTIPLWVGFLLYGDLLSRRDDQALQYRRALDELIDTTTDQALIDRAQRMGRTNPESLRKFLYDLASSLGELPEDKIAQDIIFVGHSLGGALAQHGLYFFGTRVRRIPLPGHIYHCYASDAPSIDAVQDAAFMAFGRSVQDVLVGLGQRWRITHQFEYGDVVPQSGQNHLGTTDYDSRIDSGWIDIDITVFRPKETASALEITTMPTHGRRIGLAVEGRDYTKEQLTPNELYNFDHALFLRGRLQELFGYKVFRSPQGTETTRRLIGRITRPFTSLGAVVVEHNELSPRDANGVYSVTYGS